MGITTFTVGILDEVIRKYKPLNVGEYGSQNLYLDGQPLPAPYANIYYESKGITYTCFDLSKENNCLVYDLTYLLPDEFNSRYDLVTDIGCTEHYGRDGKHHLEGFYNSWKNKHSILKVGGIMVNENPETGSWPQHGVNYYNEEFYKELAKVTDYEILELGRHPAMGNDKDGWNVYSVIRKHSEVFPSFDEFSKLPIYKS